jgi:hypothetical protein
MESYERLMNMYSQKRNILTKLKEVNILIKEQEKLVLSKRLQIMYQSSDEDIIKTINKIDKKLNKKST